MKKFFIASLIAAGMLAGAVEFRIEGENLPNKGNWIRSSGGSKLPGVAGNFLASEKYKKGDAAGNTASGTFGVPETNKYYVWVRTLDFGEGFRKTTIKINDKSIGKFGDGPVTKKGNMELKWKRAMLPVDLDGQFKVALIPANGSCRVDSIIFTTDKDYKPSDNAAEVTDSVEEIESID